jgi:hypothetical protein
MFNSVPIDTLSLNKECATHLAQKVMSDLNVLIQVSVHSTHQNHPRRRAPLETTNTKIS